MSESPTQNHLTRLVEFHRIISEQLNSRLSESPRFFWVVVAVSAGYGYVLCRPCECPKVLLLVSVLAYIVILWASWYLAALGYAFRFLQKTQHDIEEKLEWKVYGFRRKENFHNSRLHPLGLLPGIYIPHAIGLWLLSLLVSYSWWLNGYRLRYPILGSIFASGFMWYINARYMRKFGAR